MPKKTLGCEKCRGFAKLVIERNLCSPHKDMHCGDCGTNELRVYRSVLASMCGKEVV